MSGTINATPTAVIVKFKSIPSQDDRDWMKTIPGWKYQPADYSWQFPLSAAEKIQDKFTGHTTSDSLRCMQAQAADLATKQAIERAEQTTRLLAAVDVDTPLANGRVLFAHQKAGVISLLTSHRKILADDMGLGKTLVALMAAKAWQVVYSYPVLVVCPASLKDNWLREATMVGVAIEVYSWAKMPEPLETGYVFIADEAHYSQSGKKSARGQAFLDLAANKNCMACYPLTGTPLKNGRPANMWPLLMAVRAEIAQDKSAYEKRYCAAGPTRFSRWDTTGASHLDELHTKCQPVMLRRLKKECLDLPEKIRTLRKIEMSTAAQKIYDRAFADMRTEYKRRIAEGEIMDNAEAIVLLTHLRRAGSIAKVESAIELAEDILDNGNSVVLFAEFVESAQAIAAGLKSYGVELLTGDVTGKDADSDLSKRQAMVDRFQAGKSRVFVSTSRAGGVGITLTAASDVLMVDRPWTPGDTEQAEDRCHRIGQGNTVNIQWLQANGVDEKIDALLQEKSKRIDLVLLGERKTMRGTGGGVADMAKELLEEIVRK